MLIRSLSGLNFFTLLADLLNIEVDFGFIPDHVSIKLLKLMRNCWELLFHFPPLLTHKQNLHHLIFKRNFIRWFVRLQLMLKINRSRQRLMATQRSIKALWSIQETPILSQLQRTGKRQQMEALNGRRHQKEGSWRGNRKSVPFSWKSNNIFW